MRLVIAEQPNAHGHIEMQDLTPVVADEEKAVQNTKREIGTVKKSIAAMASR